MLEVFIYGVLTASLFLLFSPKRYLYLITTALSLSLSFVTSYFAFKTFGIPEALRMNLIAFDRFEISFVIDKLSAFFILVINFTVLTSLVYANGYLKPYIPKKTKLETGLHYFAFFWLQASMLGVVMLRDALGFLTFWELMSLSSFVLVMFESEKKENLKTGLNYLIQMHIAFVFILAAFLIAYSATGSDFGFESLEQYFFEHKAILLFSLFFIGFGIKAGFIPFHSWLPYAHPSAPSHISAVMSGVMIKMGIYGILRVLTYINFQLETIGIFILAFSLVSSVFGILTAAFQHDYKKLLAYCSIENIGIIGIGIGIGVLGLAYSLPLMANLGFAGALLHILNHSLFKSLLFFSAGNVYSQTHTRNMEFLGGLGKKMPATSAAFLIGAAAISGLPPFNGFISEFLIYSGLFRSLHDADITGATIILVVFTVMAIIGGLSIFGFTKLHGVVFSGSPRSESAQHAKEVSKIMLIPQFVIIVIMLIIGLVPSILLSPLSQIVDQFTGSSIEIVQSGQVLSKISLVFILFMGFVSILLLLRYLYYKKQTPDTDSTWGCGYTGADTATHQYTSSSYSSSLSHIAYRFVNRKRKYRSIPDDEIFPESRSFLSKTADVLETYLISRPVRRLMLFFERIAVFQTGKIQHYLLYALIFIFLVICLSWFNLI
jgi:formate hydrogenlyase subunit 3/multisubunit Na+/H+ antiporter MnhD subunit